MDGWMAGQYNRIKMPKYKSTKLQKYKKSKLENMQQYKTAPSDGGINDRTATKCKYKTQKYKIQICNTTK